MHVPFLKEYYNKNVKNDLMKEFSYKSIMQIPKLEKIIISMGVGQAVQNKNLLDVALEEIAIIAGQKPVKTKSKKSISNFKIRDGLPIGLKLTLRGDNMYEFLYKLINIAMPRVKDFRGVSPNSFDGYGNYSLGITEQIIFPEIDYDKIQRISGMNIAIVTTAKTDAEARALLSKLNFPFRKYK